MPLDGVFPSVDSRNAPGHLHGHKETLALLNRDVSDGEGANAEIIASFGRQAVQLVRDYATSRTHALRSEAGEESDLLKRQSLLDEAQKWDEGGAYRVAAHAAVGALGGDLAGALGAGMSARAAPAISKLTQDLPIGLRQVIGASVATALGAAGGVGGAAAGMNSDLYNRQLHPSEYELARKHAKLVAQKLHISESEAEGRIAVEILRNSDVATAVATEHIHDWEIRSLVGCSNLNCQGSEKDPQFGDHYAGWDHIQANQKTYDAGQDQIFKGQTRDALVSGNFKKDPVGTTLAGAGMIGVGVVTGGALASPGWMAAGAAIGMTVNGGVQLYSDQPFDALSFGISGATGALTAGQGVVPTALTNMGGAYAGAVVKDKNPNNEVMGAAIGTLVGYPMGRQTEKILDKKTNPWYRPLWEDVGLGISKAVKKNALPKVLGGGMDASAQEIFGNQFMNTADKRGENGG